MIPFIEFFILLINFWFIGSIKYDIEHPLLIQPPHIHRNHQSFGSSVAIIKSKDNISFIIGAPGGSSTLISIPQTGLVYSCTSNRNWTSSECKEIPLDLRRKSFKLRNPFTSGMHLGLNLAVNQVNNLMTVCGHLHTYINQQPTGICFLVDPINGGSFQILSPKHRRSMLPNSTKKTQFRPLQSHEMFGFSSIFSQNSDAIIFGIPGFDIYRGAILLLNNNLNQSNVTINTIKEVDQDSYFGYSLTIGMFFKPRTEFIAVGAPRGKELKGQVIIMTINPNDGHGNVIQELEGHQLGEYFGYSVQSIDLNADGYDDLLIGAPFHMPKTNPRGDCGRVYIHLSNGDQLDPIPTIIEGDSLFGSRFGSSLAFIGDLDLDGFNDFAVGAPQENEGSGAVYVYSGSKIKSNSKYLQKIQSSKSLGLFGFGSSIYSSIDVDNDNCPDILIGSSMSDAAILLRCLY